MKIVFEKVREVKWDRKKVKRLTKRSCVPPSPAELNMYDPLQSPKSYSNYGHDQPFGVGGVASGQLTPGGASGEAGNGNASAGGGCGESIHKGYIKLPLDECLF